MTWPTRGLIVVGALAVIASAQIPAWELPSNDAAIAPATLTNETPTLRYAVHAELRGPGPFEGLDGWVAARLDVSPAQPTAVTTIEIRSLTHPDVMPTMVMVPGTVAHSEAFMDAWLECVGDPCVEDFEVTIWRDPNLDIPPLEVTGYVDALAHGPNEAKTMPHDSEVVVSVEGPL